MKRAYSKQLTQLKITDKALTLLREYLTLTGDLPTEGNERIKNMKEWISTEKKRIAHLAWDT